MLQRLGFPAVGEHRRFVTAIAVDAVGSGVFMPVALLYFLATSPMSLVQVGSALSVAAAVALPAGPLVGSIVDRIGAKPVLLTGNLVQAGGFLAYLGTDSFAALVLWSTVVSLGQACFWGSWGPIVAAIARPGERELWFGFLGALRNVGYAVGGLVSGVAVSIGTQTAYDGVVLANAASYLVAFLLLLAVPTAKARRERTPGGWGEVLRDRPYRTLLAGQLTLSLAMLALNIAMPVYVATVLGLPGWVTGAVFTLNTVMVGFGQGLVVRAMTGSLRWRMLLLAHGVFACSYLVLLAASWLPVVAATVVVLVGVAVYTGGELVGGPVQSALAAEAAPDHLRGRYLSLVQMVWGVAGVVTPAAYSWLLDRGPAPVWLVLVAIAGWGALLAARLGRVLPRAAERVSNRVEEATVAD